MQDIPKLMVFCENELKQRDVSEEEQVLDDAELNEVSGGWEPGKKYVGREDIPFWLL